MNTWTAERERELCKLAARGDRAALRTLMEHFADPLFAGVILPRVGNRADAEDILRETLARAVERFEDFVWQDSGLFPWLRRIAVNRVVDRSRRLAARRRMEESYQAEVAVLPPRIEAGAEAALIEQQERAACLSQLERALSAIHERYRRAIDLRIVQERSREQAASELGVTVATFDVILHRALTALRKAYGEVT